MSDVLIKVENVSKKYCKDLKRSMGYGVSDIARNMIGRPANSGTLRKDEFWAVSDVSFEIKRGEALGIIGPNGSGKTTLLKMLNGIFWPDKGKISVYGKVGALIEVGAGFHPLLTGRENIYINGAILGMTKKEIDKEFDSIVDFAAIGDFLDTPVKHYSSGMFIRLGFAVAVHSKPDILLVDEVLAVGDVSFRAKCYEKIEDIRKNCAIVFVSHNFSAVSRVSSTALLLNKGKSFFKGDVSKTIEKYSVLLEGMKKTTHTSGVVVEKHKINLPEEEGKYIVSTGESAEIELEINSIDDYEDVSMRVCFLSLASDFVAEWNSSFQNISLNLKKGFNNIKIQIGPIDLNPGIYRVSLLISSRNSLNALCWINNGWCFKVKGDQTGNAPYEINGKTI